MRALKTAYYRKAFSAIFADDQGTIGFKQAVRVLGINNQIRKVEWTPDHPLTFVAFLPCCAPVVRHEQRALR